MNDDLREPPPVDRRAFLERAGGGFGMLALASLWLAAACTTLPRGFTE